MVEQTELYLVRAVGWYPRKRDDDMCGPKRPNQNIPVSWMESTNVPSRLSIPVAASSPEEAESIVSDMDCVESLRDKPTTVMDYVGTIE